VDIENVNTYKLTTASTLCEYRRFILFLGELHQQLVVREQN